MLNPHLKNARLELQERGYHVHPLCPPNHKCGSPGKVPHIKGWDYTVTINPQLYNKNHNLGIRVDHPLFIVDCDIKDDTNGVEQLKELYLKNDTVLPEPTVITGSGGVHYWLRMPDDTDIACNRKLDTGIDTRSDGRGKKGQVVVPPSVHSNGTYYEWVNDLPPHIDDLPEVPSWMIDMVKYVEPKHTEREPDEHDVPVEADASGFDYVTGRYWQGALDKVANMSPGGDGQRSRNTSIFGLGATAKKLYLCAKAHGEAHRITPSGSIFLDGAVTAARAAGLKGDIERQFKNGWNADNSPKCPDPKFRVQTDRIDDVIDLCMGCNIAKIEPNLTHHCHLCETIVPRGEICQCKT